MPNFHYIGRDSRGEKSTGSLEAHTAIDAMNQLRRRGLRVERLQSEEDRVAEEMRSEPVTATSDPAGAPSGRSQDRNSRHQPGDRGTC